MEEWKFEIPDLPIELVSSTTIRELRKLNTIVPQDKVTYLVGKVVTIGNIHHAKVKAIYKVVPTKELFGRTE